MLIFVLPMNSTVYALTPPFGFWSNCLDEIKILLQDYIDRGGGYTRWGDIGCGIVYRNIIFPDVTDHNFFLYEMSFREEQWGGGVSVGSFTFVERGTRFHGYLQDRSYISVGIRFRYQNPLDYYRTNFALSRDSIVSTHEGIYNGKPFYGYSFAMPNGNIFSSFNMVVGGFLVSVTKSRPFSEDSLRLVVFEETDILYPIDVQFVLGAVSPWAVEYVNEALAKNLVPNTLLTQSNVQRCLTLPVTRAEFAALAVRLYETNNDEITGRVSFTDTRDVNVEKLAYIGVITGVGDNRFSPNRTLTREEAAVILSRLSYAMGQPLPIQTANFADGDISSWAIDGIGQVHSAGIMGGVGGNMFAPQQSFSREQSIITILRLYRRFDLKWAEDELILRTLLRRIDDRRSPISNEIAIPPAMI